MKREKMINELLCYMRDKVVAVGGSNDTIRFDFVFSDNGARSEDLIAVRKRIKTTDKIIQSLLRECITDGYIKRFAMNKEFEFLRITDIGMSKAKLVQLVSPRKQFISSVLYHPLFNTFVSSILSFAVGYYLGGK